MKRNYLLAVATIIMAACLTIACEKEESEKDSSFTAKNDSTSNDSTKCMLGYITSPGEPAHTLRAIILDGNGQDLTGVTYRITCKGSVVVQGVTVGNTFELTNLVDGDYEIVVTRNGYKEADRSVSLKFETGKLEDGTVAEYAQNVEAVFYLEEMRMSKSLSFGSTSNSDMITLETTKQNDGSGHIVTTTDESVDGSDADNEGLIEVAATVDAVSTSEFNTGATNTDGSPKSDYDVLAEALAEDGTSIDDLSFFMTGVSSLEDAADVAAGNGIASRTLTRASTTALPGGYEILTGMAVNTGTVDVDFKTWNLPQRLAIELSLPDNDCKNAVRLYRTFKGDSWAELSLTGGTLPTDVTIDMTQDKKIVVTLSRLRTQSFALGVQIIEESKGTGTEYINTFPIQNTTATDIPVPAMRYNAKSGAVMKNEYNGSLTDFLRKIIQKKCGLRAVKDPTVEKEYAFHPVYQLPAGGNLFLVGWQNYGNYRYSICNSNAAFSVTDYQSEFVYPYVTYESFEPEEPIYSVDIDE